MHGIDVVGFASIYACDARGRGRGRARFARQALEPLLFIVGDVYYDKGGYAGLCGFEELSDVLETGSAGAADVYWGEGLAGARGAQLA
jgi:hypothetical protein